jgi:chromosome partitioning protein
MTTEKTAMSVDFNGLGKLAEKSKSVLAATRDTLFEPDPDKPSPFFTTATVASLCGVSRRRIADMSNMSDYPRGVIPEGSNTKHFTVKETQTFVRALKDLPKRPEGKRGRIIAVTVFKGGTSKTTTSLSLAQGLALYYGRKVLLIDSDPQGSLGTYVGLQPEVAIALGDTMIPYIFGDEPDLRYAVRKTYWDNIDIIPGNFHLYEADFHMPVAYMTSNRTEQFWNTMIPGLHDIAKDYDVVIIDTPPAMNYLTTSLIYAADALIQPIPPRSVDFASAIQFWSLLFRLLSEFAKHDPDIKQKVYDYIKIVPSRVRPKETNDVVMGQMGNAFESCLSPTKLPESSAMENLSFMLQTIYDQYTARANIEDHRRYKDRMDELVAMVDRQLMASWGVKPKGKGSEKESA